MEIILDITVFDRVYIIVYSKYVIFSILTESGGSWDFIL